MRPVSNTEVWTLTIQHLDPQSATSVKGVTLCLTKVDGIQIPNYPLNPHGCALGEPAQLDINPGDQNKQYEVLEWLPDKEIFDIHYYLTYQEFKRAQQSGSPMIDTNLVKYEIDTKSQKKHILNLVATGQNIPATEKEFTLEILKGHVLFNPVTKK